MSVRDAELRLLRDVCGLPTAPFVEGRVLDFVDAFADRNENLHISRDPSGNRLLLAGRTSKSPRLIFVAHTDHPGFVASRMIDRRHVRADFRGGVRPEFVKHAAVRFFLDDDSELVGHVTKVQSQRGRPRTKSAVIKVEKPVPRGAIGMFDLPPTRIRGRKLHGRAMDDLAGVGAILAALRRLAKKKLPSTVGALFTRGEEEGFVGAIAAARDRKLLRRTDLLVSVETSAKQPFAKQGRGVVIRVGDRLSVFDDAITRHLDRCAAGLLKRRKHFARQRALMPGGACEATAFNAFGLRCGAACLALGNYHNMNLHTGRVAMEHIHLDDWSNMVDLFEEAGRKMPDFDAAADDVRSRLMKLHDRSAMLL